MTQASNQKWLCPEGRCSDFPPRAWLAWNSLYREQASLEVTDPCAFWVAGLKVCITTRDLILFNCTALLINGTIEWLQLGFSNERENQQLSWFNFIWLYLCDFLLFEIGSHVTQYNLKLAMYLSMALNPRSSWLYVLTDGIIGLYQKPRFILWVAGKYSTTELHPQALFTALGRNHSEL